MSSVGVIVEFNPLHKGHVIHLTKTKKMTGCKKIVAVMSGNFVQRGEPAICDKWQRTKMALTNGVDIVIELPLPYVISGADYFARGSVGLLSATGIVSVLSFGSESGDLNSIIAVGKILKEEPDEYKNALRKNLDKGLSFASAKGAALEECLTNIPPGILNKPNNVLAAEYAKAVFILKNKIELLTTYREEGGFSATRIRKMLKSNKDVKEMVPKNVYEELNSTKKFLSIDDFSDIFRYLIYSKDIEMGEGLENRFRRFCGQHNLISDLLAEVKTKRYTYTRLQRIVMKTILNITKDDMELYDTGIIPPYIKVLGFRKESEQLLSEMTQKAMRPVITNGAAFDRIRSTGGVIGKMLDTELMAGDIYNMIAGNGSGYRGERSNAMIVI